MQVFNTLPVAHLKVEDQVIRAMRLNCHGSLFYFIRNALRRKRLTEKLHLPLCLTFEREHIKDVIEMPRDHFKSTCASEGLAMWRALPFTQQDEDDFYALGYNDHWIQWMHKAHNPDSRNLLVSGNITNAAKLGKKIRWHFDSNSLYRTLFPETIPDTSCTWTDYSLHVKRPTQGAGGAHGEGTFDFLGVGSAVQSRHYNGLVIEDDLIGIKESESQALMEKAIDYHQLLAGIFEAEDPNHELDELVIGNRWAYDDLNSWMREHENISNNSYGFRFESHSALGGCCDRHPADTPIFPEEFSHQKLIARKNRLGSYKFSCQFLNDPSSPEDSEFKVEWLNYFELVKNETTNKWLIKRETKNGCVYEDVRKSQVNLAMVVDPNHSGNAAGGRCRHAIVVDAVDADNNHYILDSWADNCGYDAFYEKIFQIAMKWGLHKVGVETIGAQTYIKNHIEYLCAVKCYSLRVEDLKGAVDLEDGTTARSKKFRICGVIQPLSESQHLWVQHTQQSFINEYKTFSMKRTSRFLDQLDAFAYAPQIAHRPVDDTSYMDQLAANQAGMDRLGHPYTAGYGRSELTGVKYAS